MNPSFGYWADPKSVIGEIGSSCIREIIDEDHKTELKVVRDQNQDLANLFLLVATDAKKLQTKSNSHLKSLRLEANNLRDELLSREFLIAQLQIDIEAKHTQLQEQLFKETTNKDQIFHLESELVDCKSEILRIQAEYDKFQRNSNQNTDMLTSRLQECEQSVCDMRDMLHTSKFDLEASKVLALRTRKEGAAVYLYMTLESLQRRLCHRALCNWRAMSSHKTAVYHASLKFENMKAVSEKDWNQQLSDSKATHVQEKSLLKDEYNVRLEEQRRKYVRVQDSRNFLIFDLIKSKRMTAERCISKWKSVYISKLLVDLFQQRLLGESIRRELLQHINTTHQHRGITFAHSIHVSIRKSNHAMVKRRFAVWSRRTELCRWEANLAIEMSQRSKIEAALLKEVSDAHREVEELHQQMTIKERVYTLAESIRGQELQDLKEAMNLLSLQNTEILLELSRSHKQDMMGTTVKVALNALENHDLMDDLESRDKQIRILESRVYEVEATNQDFHGKIETQATLLAQRLEENLGLMKIVNEKGSAMDQVMMMTTELVGMRSGLNVVEQVIAQKTDEISDLRRKYELCVIALQDAHEIIEKITDIQYIFR
jgi:hypothetical protein